LLVTPKKVCAILTAFIKFLGLRLWLLSAFSLASDKKPHRFGKTELDTHSGDLPVVPKCRTFFLLNAAANHRLLVRIPCPQEGRVDRHETLGAGSDGRVVSQGE
jgi:hypothetical protein